MRLEDFSSSLLSHSSWPVVLSPSLVYAAATQASSTDHNLGARRVLVRPRGFGNQLVPRLERIPPIYVGDEQRDEAGRRPVQAHPGKLDQRPPDPGGGGQPRRESRRRVRQRGSAYVLPQGGVGKRRLEGHRGRGFFGHNRTQTLSIRLKRTEISEGLARRCGRGSSPSEYRSRHHLSFAKSRAAHQRRMSFTSAPLSGVSLLRPEQQEPGDSAIPLTIETCALGVGLQMNDAAVSAKSRVHTARYDAGDHKQVRNTAEAIERRR